MARTIAGTGGIEARGVDGTYGLGRVRFDVYENTFSGYITATFTQGFQPIILPAAGQGIQLNIASVGGTAISASPGGVLVNPDVIISAQKTNPIPIVVNCSNIPLNTEITVKVQPANGTPVTAVGTNNTGTLAASTATVLVNMPRGGGIVYASAVTGIAGTASLGSGEAANVAKTEAAALPLSQTGWTADGERFKAIEVTASLGGKQQVAYISESGKRYPLN